MNPIAVVLCLGFVAGLSLGGEADVAIKFKNLCERIPDLSLKYDIENLRQNEVRHVHYTQQQGKFRYDIKTIRAGKPEVLTGASFDGSRFYSLLQDKTLIVGKDPRAGGNGASIAYIQSCFLENPVFCLLGFVHEQSKNNPFYPPNMLSLNSWVDTALKLRGQAGFQEGNFTYRCERETGFFTDMVFDSTNNGVGSIVLNNPDGYRYGETVKKWFQISHAPQTFSMPLTIECQQRRSKNQPMTVVAWRRINEETVRLLDDKSQPTFVCHSSLRSRRFHR
ncbi:MAG: hypothetical protein JWO08_4072 [Verrucomicrobiaceae bacterium]|nr:hypothetical protein [Verrucomicrobiaceae bacterium]